MQLEEDRITRMVYMWSQSLAGEGSKNWAWKTKKLLDDIKDFGGLLSTDELWDALAQQELTQWENTVKTPPEDSESGGRFKFYRQFKTSPVAEDYVLNPVTLNKRRVLTQLRCGCLPLEIETGRYRSPKPPVSERTCHLCQSETGNEPHFLLKCPMLCKHRETMLKAMTENHQNFPALSDEEKTVLILKACGSLQAVSDPVYWMYRERYNLLAVR